MPRTERQIADIGDPDLILVIPEHFDRIALHHRPFSNSKLWRRTNKATDLDWANVALDGVHRRTGISLFRPVTWAFGGYNLPVHAHIPLGHRLTDPPEPAQHGSPARSRRPIASLARRRAEEPGAQDAIRTDSILSMPNVLIRDVSPDDLEEIRSAATERGTSLQSYLRDAVHDQAAYLRRRTALARTAKRLRGQPAVPDQERQAVFDAIDDAHTERADQLIDPSAR